MTRLLSLLFLFCEIVSASVSPVKSPAPVASATPVTPRRSRLARDARFMVGLGFGLPQLAGIDLSYRLMPSWQVGLGYGLIPGGQGGITPGFSLPSQNVTLANNTFVTFDKPTISTSLNSICPFVRFYSNPTDFYLQLTVGMFLVKNSFSSEILDVNGTKITDASYNGIITVTQMLPTLSMGHVFSSDLFFFNVNMGVTVVATASIDTAITSELPDRLGGTAGNQETLDTLKANSQAAVNAGLKAFRDEVLFLPAVQLTFGFMF